MVMFLVNHLLYLSGFLSLVFTQSTSSFCSGDLCYIRPSESLMTWLEAQRICSVFNSTLPIADNTDHQKSFVKALDHFLLNISVWLGGKASYGDYHNWYWLNGMKYSVTDVDVQNQGSYNTSYAYVRNTTIQVMAYADAAFHRYSYICQFSDEAKCVSSTGQTAFSIENRCYVKFAENLPWFQARNNCLSNGGDLASFDNLSSLDSILDYNAYWVGLTSSWWNWYNSDQSRNFSFTLWNSQEPNDETPNCISTDTFNFPTWRDLQCNTNQFFICQIVNTSATTYSHLTSLYTTSSSVVTAPTATSQISSTIGKSMPDSENSTIPLAVGLGVGISVFVIVVIVVAVLVIRSYRKSFAAKIQALEMAVIQALEMGVKTDEVSPYESLKHQPRGNDTGNLTYQDLTPFELERRTNLTEPAKIDYELV